MIYWIQLFSFFLSFFFFCSSVIISVKINHGAISLPRLITTQAVTTGTDISVPKSLPARFVFFLFFLMKFNAGRSCTQGETYRRTLRGCFRKWFLCGGQKGPRLPSVDPRQQVGVKLLICLRVRWTTVACAANFNPNSFTLGKHHRSCQKVSSFLILACLSDHVCPETVNKKQIEREQLRGGLCFRSSGDADAQHWQR